jgi:hypothetical protein
MQMPWAVLAYGRGGGGIPSPLIALAVVVLIVLVLSQKPARQVITKLVPGGRRWSPEDNRAVFKFCEASRKLDPQRYAEELLKLAKQLARTPDATKIRVSMVEGLADPKRKSLTAPKGLQQEWEKYKGK